jgi:hypothetical protein
MNMFGVPKYSVNNRMDALAAPAADILTNDFMEILVPDAPPVGPLEP